MVAHAKPDGYTLVIHGVNGLAIAPHVMKVDYDPIADFAPIINWASAPMLLVVNREVPAANADAYALQGATHQSDVYLGTRQPKDSIAKAVALTQKALSMNGSLAEARSRLGVLYSWSGRYDEGIAEAKRGVELDPNSGQANFNLAVVLRYAGKSKEAIPVIQRALRLEPVAPDIYIQNLALVHFQTGDCKEAIAACEKGLKRQSDNLNSHVIMAAVLGSCGKDKGARKEATEVLRINPKFTVESYTRVLPYKNPSDRDRTAQGLRKAGLP